MKLILLIIAIVLFLLAALSVAFPHALEWGFVAFAASFLPIPDTHL